MQQGEWGLPYVMATSTENCQTHYRCTSVPCPIRPLGYPISTTAMRQRTVTRTGWGRIDSGISLGKASITLCRIAVMPMGFCSHPAGTLTDLELG